MKKLFLCFATLFFSSLAVFANPWFTNFVPVRELYVSPNGTAGYAIDYSPTHSQTTVLGNMILSSGGVQGEALQIGAPSGYSLKLNTSISFGTTMSASAWFKTSGTGIGYILGNGGAGTGGGAYIFGVNQGKLYLAIDEVSSARMAGCADRRLELYSPSLVNDGNWHFAAVTVNQATKIATLYLDGIKTGELNFSSVVSSCVEKWQYVGGNPNGNWPYANLNGYIDELRVYNKVLSAQEITEQYSGSNQYGNKNEVGLTTAFHFDSGGAPGSSANPYSPQSAAASAQAGDLFWFNEGVYNTGVVNFTKNGTVQNPIVFRALPNSRVTINGYFYVDAENTWIWGMEFTGLDDLNKTKGNNISLVASGTRAINNIIHDGVGMGVWNPFGNGAGQVIYGNIVYSGNEYTFQQRGHNVYAQNDYYRHGYQYFINNMFLEAPKQSCNLVTSNGTVTDASDCFSFHVYTQSGQASGIWAEQNFIGEGRFLIGATSGNNDHNMVKDNFFYKSNPQVGYPSGKIQYEFLNNYVVDGKLTASFFWVTAPIPNRILGNSIFSTGTDTKIDQLWTYGDTGCGGCVPITPETEWDNNTYGPMFSADQMNANNVRINQMFSLAAWQQATLQGGKMLDANSVVVPLPTTPKIVLNQNEYEPDRASLGIYNWSGASSVAVDLSNVVPTNSDYSVYYARDFYGAPVVSGTYSGVVNIPVGIGLNSFVVKVNGGQVMPTPTPTATPSPTTTPTPTPSPSPTPVATPTPNPIPTPSPTPTPTVTPTPPTTAADAVVSGRVTNSRGRGINKVTVTFQASGSVYKAITNPFGYYSVTVKAGETYFISVTAKNYSFDSKVIFVSGDTASVNFIGN